MKKNSGEKKIYIILTYTGTVLSKIIRRYTRYEFSHVSIASDSELNEMYSFGRLRAYNPFVAGFVQENPHKGTFKRFKDTTTEVYSMTISREQFENLKATIRTMKRNSSEYRYNMLGLCALVMHKKLKRENAFYCAEFVQYVLDSAEVETNLPALVKPSDFIELDNLNLEYRGRLKDYNPVSI
ncbi:MAG: hypothetical protein ACI39R_06670 [Lachnospiraceae bacterium]